MVRENRNEKETIFELQWLVVKEIMVEIRKKITTTVHSYGDKEYGDSKSESMKYDG